MPRLRLDDLGGRLRLLATRLLSRLGMGEGAFLVPMALVIGVVTSGAAVAFHELIDLTRHWLYVRSNPHFSLYGRGIIVLIALPALGGLIVGLISRYVVRAREGHGLIDVLESVLRNRGVVRPLVAVEKIVTAGITIGSGGSAGAEGPIVQIGASIASGVGQFFKIARQSMPVLIGCGAAAGISAIFNSPIGGVLFVLEVVLRDFSLRTFTPVVLASVVANVTTQAIYRRVHHLTEYERIFAVPRWAQAHHTVFDWGQVGNFIVLGVICGAVAVATTRLMYFTETWFERLRFPQVLKPALGGALVGVMGVAYVMIFGWGLLGQNKPFPFEHYPMPAFFGDGYGVIRRLLSPDFYPAAGVAAVLLLVACLIPIKVAATCLTLGSGGAGGIIAPSLFLGAATGAVCGILLRESGLFPGLRPEFYALVGMGAVLGAVVHAPLAGILILFDITLDPSVMVPAMLTTITATGFARLLFRDSIYTLALRRRGVLVGSGSVNLLQRLTVEQVDLEPATTVDLRAPIQSLLQRLPDGRMEDLVVTAAGEYEGVLLAQDLQLVLWEREAIPLLTADDLVRGDIAPVLLNDDLASVLDAFTRYDTPRLPVVLPNTPGKVIGIVTRAAVVRRYQRAIAEGA